MVENVTMNYYLRKSPFILLLATPRGEQCAHRGISKRLSKLLDRSEEQKTT